MEAFVRDIRRDLGMPDLLVRMDPWIFGYPGVCI
jgi:hypothetical protein